MIHYGDYPQYLENEVAKLDVALKINTNENRRIAAQRKDVLRELEQAKKRQKPIGLFWRLFT